MKDRDGARSHSHVVQAMEPSKGFGEFAAVDRVSSTIERGTVFWFLGPNGAGKTRTIRMLLGLLRPTSGQATVLGLDIVRHTAASRSASATCHSALACTTT